MTIIVTQINKFGIVFGSDSNISNDIKVVKEAKKIFEILKLKAAMCTAGSYTVKGETLDAWLPDFISTNENNYSTLEEFTKLLSQELEKEMAAEEKRGRFITHIAGYKDSHPEMWHISNTILQENGQYTTGKDNFHYSEDLWKRDWRQNNLEVAFNSTNSLNYQIYVNGFTPGRIAFNVVRKFIDDYFKLMWQLNDFKFRPPKNIREHEELVKVYINLIHSMFQLSDYKPKIVGGPSQIFIIENPSLRDNSGDIIPHP